MKPLFIISILSFGCVLLSLLAIKVFINRAFKNNLLDCPNERKLQKTATPTSGGVPFITVFYLFLIIAYFFELIGDKLLLIAAISSILLMLGFKDDRQSLSPKLRFVIELIVASIVCVLGYRIKSLFGIFGVFEIEVYIQYPLTIFVIVAIINAFNLIDGIDGLLGGLTLINFIIFSVLFFSLGEVKLGTFCLLFASSILGFLYFNYNPAKIFMGDAGSLTIGFLTIIMGLSLINIQTAPTVPPTAHLIVISMMLIPIFDTLRVIIIRLLKKRSPFRADLNHAHHYLIKFGFNHKKSALFILMSHTLLIIICIESMGYFKNDTLLILILLTIALSEGITYKKIISKRISQLRETTERRAIIDKSEIIQKNLQKYKS